MADAYLSFYAGETAPVFGSVEFPKDTTGTINGSPTYTLRDEVQAVVIGHNAQPVTGYDTDALNKVRAWKTFSFAGLSGGYAVEFSIPVFTPGTILEIRTPRALLEIIPAGSLLLSYVEQVREMLRDQMVGEVAERLWFGHYRRALARAVRAFSEDRPRELSADVALTTGTTEYALPTGWLTGKSRFRSVEYPRGGTVRTFLFRSDYRLDETRGKWGFVALSPQTGQTAGLEYTGLWNLTHAADSLPAEVAPWVVAYAAGDLLQGSLANEAAQTNDPQAEMQVVSYRDMTARRRQQGMELKAEARKMWAGLTWRDPLDYTPPTSFGLGKPGTLGRGR